MRTLLVPDWTAARLAAGQALRGMGVAAVYGFVHDQVTFRLSPEYFLRLKFGQFPWLAEHLPPAVAVGAVGVAGAWWMGLIGWWVLARVVLAGGTDAFNRVMRRAVVLVMLSAAGAAVAGGVLASRIDAGESWIESVRGLGVENVGAFTTVAGVHWGSYAGSAGAWLYLVGTQLVQVWKSRRRAASSGKI
jgi:hypothetical protein